MSDDFIRCTNCGNNNLKGSKTCLFCDHKLPLVEEKDEESKICPSCQMSLAKDAKNCPFCGWVDESSLDEDIAISAPVPTPTAIKKDKKDTDDKDDDFSSAPVPSLAPRPSLDAKEAEEDTDDKDDDFSSAPVPSLAPRPSLDAKEAEEDTDDKDDDFSSASMPSMPSMPDIDDEEEEETKTTKEQKEIEFEEKIIGYTSLKELSTKRNISLFVGFILLASLIHYPLNILTVLASTTILPEIQVIDSETNRIMIQENLSQNLQISGFAFLTVIVTTLVIGFIFGKIVRRKTIDKFQIILLSCIALISIILLQTIIALILVLIISPRDIMFVQLTGAVFIFCITNVLLAFSPMYIGSYYLYNSIERMYNPKRKEQSTLLSNNVS